MFNDFTYKRKPIIFKIPIFPRKIFGLPTHFFGLIHSSARKRETVTGIFFSLEVMKRPTTIKNNSGLFPGFCSSSNEKLSPRNSGYNSLAYDISYMLKRAYSNVLDFSKKLTKLDNNQTEVFLKEIIMITIV